MAEYYMPALGDSYPKKVMTWLRTGKRFRPSFPRAIQIQTTSFCNARCVFCGYTHTRHEVEQGVMEESLFRKIVDECCQHYIGRISPFLMNEPLMDKHIFERIAYIEKHKKFCTRTKISSNGSLLTEDASRGLIESGLGQLWISVNGYSEETYNKSMNLEIDKVLANIDKFLEIRAKMNSKRPKLIITTLRTALVEKEIDYARKYWSERDVVFNTHHLDNRAGTDLSDLRLPEKKVKYKRNCDLFLKQAYVVWNGDLILCCHDWKRTVVLGNLREQSLKEIWNSQKFIALIHAYQQQKFDNLEICRTCS